jgi:hypothetical protein
MQAEEIISLVAFYKNTLESMNVIPERITTSKSFYTYRNNSSALLSHALYLCVEFKSHTKEDKQNRHLTAIQMCVSFAGMYTLDELMRHNKYGV